MLNNVTVKRLVQAAGGLMVTLIVVLCFVCLSTLQHLGTAFGHNADLVHRMLLAKDVRFHVVQIQQFLTDAGATGLEDPVEEARAHLNLALAKLDGLARAAAGDVPADPGDEAGGRRAARHRGGDGASVHQRGP